MRNLLYLAFFRDIYFPIDYEPKKFVQGIVIGLIITFFAGYIPAKKAANVDPVDILRK